MKSYEYILYEAITKHYITTTSLNTYRYSPKTILQGISNAVAAGHLNEVDIEIRNGHNSLVKKFYHITEDGLRYFICSCNEAVPWADLIKFTDAKLYFTEYKRELELIAANYIRGIYPAIMIDAIGGNEIICSYDDDISDDKNGTLSSVTELGKILLSASDKMGADICPPEFTVSNCVKPHPPESTAAECVEPQPTEPAAAECVRRPSPESTAAESVEQINGDQLRSGKQRKARLADIILAAKRRYEYAIANSPKLADPVTSSRSNIHYAHSLQVKRIIEEQITKNSVSKTRYDVRGGTFSGIVWTQKDAYLTYTALPGLLSTIYPRAFDRDEFAAMKWMTQIQHISFSRTNMQAIQFIPSTYTIKRIWNELFSDRTKAATETTMSRIFSLKNFWIVPISQDGTSELASILHGQDISQTELSARLTSGHEYRINNEWYPSEFPFIDELDNYCIPLPHLEVKQLLRIMRLSKQYPDKDFCLLYSSPWQSRYLGTLFDLKNYGNVSFTNISSYLSDKNDTERSSMLQIEREGIIARNCLGLE